MNKLSCQSHEILYKTVWLRCAQILVNERIKQGHFKVPIHLALGHEAIAISVDRNIDVKDVIFLTHRNIHYNLARVGRLKEVVDEYYLKKSGISSGQLGSMNMSNSDKGVMYTSNILGNNFSIGSGYSLGNKVRNKQAVVFIVTGDGAIEEGSFYENLMFLKSNNLMVIVIVENNQWSLGTKDKERRCDIDLKKIAGSLHIKYLSLTGNDPIQYSRKIKKIKKNVIRDSCPALIEANLTTLGSWWLRSDDYKDEKFINYHAGAAPEVSIDKNCKLLSSADDPMFVVESYLSKKETLKVTQEIYVKLKLEMT